MRTLYIDCFSGLAGDMMLGALFDLAVNLGEDDRVNPSALTSALSPLSLPPWRLEVEPRHKQGIRGLGVSVLTLWGEERVQDVTPDQLAHTSSPHHGHHNHDDHAHEDHETSSSHGAHHVHGRSLIEILDLISNSGLSERVQRRARAVFEALGEAEGRAHGIPPLEVSFHEVGMIDSIVDILGAAWCLDALEVTQIISAPPPLNRGWVKCAHGLMPLPAPATSFLLTGLETAESPHSVELITPTGAAMIRAWAREINARWPKSPTLSIGWGAGRRDLSDRPNLLRVILNETEPDLGDHRDLPPSRCWLIEANIDDQTPEALATARDLLLASGALDVWLTAIVMKEGRSAVTLSVLSASEQVDELERLLLIHSAAIGCRRSRWERAVLPRRIMSVVTPWGSCRVKVTRLPDEISDQASETQLEARWRLKVEHRDVRALALKHQRSVAEIEREVLDQAHALLRSGQLTWDDLAYERTRSSDTDERS